MPCALGLLLRGRRRPLGPDERREPRHQLALARLVDQEPEADPLARRVHRLGGELAEVGHVQHDARAPCGRLVGADGDAAGRDVVDAAGKDHAVRREGRALRVPVARVAPPLRGRAGVAALGPGARGDAGHVRRQVVPQAGDVLAGRRVRVEVRDAPALALAARQLGPVRQDDRADRAVLGQRDDRRGGELVLVAVVVDQKHERRAPGLDRVDHGAGELQVPRVRPGRDDHQVGQRDRRLRRGGIAARGVDDHQAHAGRAEPGEAGGRAAVIPGAHERAGPPVCLPPARQVARRIAIQENDRPGAVGLGLRRHVAGEQGLAAARPVGNKRENPHRETGLLSTERKRQHAAQCGPGRGQTGSARPPGPPSRPRSARFHYTQRSYKILKLALIPGARGIGPTSRGPA